VQLDRDGLTDASERDGANISCLIVDQPDFAGEPVRLLHRALITRIDLVQEIAQEYRDGIALFEKWSTWQAQMLTSAPPEMQATLQQTDIGGWHFYFLNRTLLVETFTGILLALALSLLILTLATLNPIMSCFSIFTIVLIVVDVFAFTVLMGFRLGVLEAVNYVVVIGLSIDYCVHMSEAYTESHHPSDRRLRVQDMVTEMGVSVISGAMSTLGCVFFMFFAPNVFFFRFACFVTATITLSCVYALVFFPALLAIFGPQGTTGDLKPMLRRVSNAVAEWTASWRWPAEATTPGGISTKSGRVSEVGMQLEESAASHNASLNAAI